MKPLKAAIATGTRADWGLLQPLAESLRRSGAELSIIACHQHLMPGMGNTLAEIRADGFNPVALITAEGSAAQIMAQSAAGFADAMRRLQPDCMIILGDRCEMLGAASAALLCGVPIVHIAGGTVSEGAFDDSVRHAITKMATLHFPETQLCANRIIQMGEDPKMVHAVGAAGVENTLKIPRMSLEELRDSLEGFDPGEDFLVVTLHSATLEEGDPLCVQMAMLDALEALPENIRMIITYPNSDIDPTPLIKNLHDFERRMNGRVKVVASLGRVRYLSAVALSRGVVGNSSSGLVEVPSLRVPTLDIGSRQKGREHGRSVIHCGVTSPEISEGLRQLLSEEMRQIALTAPNPYAGTETVATMTRIIKATQFHPFPSKTFHPIPKLN